MPVIIRDGKFTEDGFIGSGGGFIQLDEFSLSVHHHDVAITGLDVPNDTQPQALAGLLNAVAAIRIPFSSHADGRGFSIARRLRQMGFGGLLRAQGHVLADQYPLALRSGFDEIEIYNDLAGRMPQSQWLDSFNRVSNNYLDRLRLGESGKAA